MENKRLIGVCLLYFLCNYILSQVNKSIDSNPDSILFALELSKAEHLMLAEKYDEALFELNQDKYLFEEAGFPYLNLSAKAYKIRGYCYMNLWKNNLASIDFKKSISIKKNFLKIPEYELFQEMDALAKAFHLAEQYDSSILILTKLIDSKIKYFGPYDLSIAENYSQLGDSYHMSGDPSNARIQYINALEIRTILNKDDPKIIGLYYIIGWSFTNETLYAQGEPFILKAFETRKRMLEENDEGMAESYYALGAYKNHIGEYETSYSLIEKGYRIARANWGFDLYIARYLNAMGSSYSHLGKCQTALKHYQEALGVCLELAGPKHVYTAISYGGIARCLGKMKEYEKALFYADSAQVALGFNIDSIDEKIDPVRLIRTLQYKSDIQLERIKHQTNDSLLFDYLKSSDDYLKIINHYKEDKRFAHSKKSISAYSLRFFENGINVFSKIYHRSKSEKYFSQALMYSESLKSQRLYELFQETKIESSDGIPRGLINELNTLELKIRTGINKTVNLIGISFNDNKTLSELEIQYRMLLKEVSENYPEYYQIKYCMTNINVNYIQDTLLTPKQTLLEYFVGDSSIFIFTVGKEQYDVVEVKRDFPLEDWVKQLQHGLTGYYTQPLAQRNDDLYKTTVKQYMEASQQLYVKLIARVKEKLNTPELIIVPDGLLGYVPFGALLSGQPKRASIFDTYPFLEKEYKISYCYSATLLREMKEKQHKRQPTGSLVAFAPFYEGSYTKLDSTFSISFDTLSNGEDTLIFNDIATRKDFNNLPASGEEVKAASLFWDGDYYLNSDATEDRFNEVAGNYRIVHLSTHGVADSRSGDYSYLAFAEQKDSIENELLYVRDLYNIQLNADLVTLSACETAAGELQRGEGIISLARAFAYAGAKSIVTTLWVAEDNATKDLMKVFYQQLKKGDAKDLALQKAKLKLLDDRRHAHPFFWAGFVPVGDMSALK